jgi:membrane-associated protein
VTAPYDAVNWLADRIFVLLADLFRDFGTPIVFLAALAEATVGLGVVVPGVVLIFLAGAYAAEEGQSIPLMLAVAAAGTMLGDTISYAAGRFGSARLGGTRVGPALRYGEAVVRDALERGRLRWLIPFYHLNSVTRAVGPFGAGAVRLPLRIWLPLDYAGAVVANTAWMGAGALLGRAVLTPDGSLEQHPALRIGLFVAAVAWLLFVRREVLRSRRRTRAAPPTPVEAAPTEG